MPASAASDTLDTRRLAVILVADVVGSSRLIEADERYGLSAIRAVLNDVLIAAAGRHGGRLIKTMGDGALLEFTSPVAAAICADEVQRTVTQQAGQEVPERRVLLRIGINLGDVVTTPDGDLYGDGVNVAARLENIADPGSVFISAAVHDHLVGKSKLIWEDRGLVELKNIARSIRVWALRGASQESNLVASNFPKLPDKPSIAVLPFTNISGDPDQDYFADGVVEEIITALARFPRLFVIARNSSFIYKGKAVDVRQIGRELGVRYVLEGSIRKAGARVRLSGQLVEAMTGMHLWADKFDSDLADIFALQDDVTTKVVTAIEPRLKLSEIEGARRRRPDSLTAYDLYLRALPHLNSMTKEGLESALSLAYQALAIDPRYSVAAALGSVCLGYSNAQGWTEDPKLAVQEAMRLAHLALALDETDPDILSWVGRMTAYTSDDYATAIEMVDRAVAVNPNSAMAWGQRGWAYQYAGQANDAIRSFEQAIRLSPFDLMLYSTLTGMGCALLRLDRYEEAVVATRKSLRQNSRFTSTHRCLAASLALLGLDEQAKDVAGQMLVIEPNFKISEWISRSASGHSPQMIKGLQLAGLPMS